MARAVSAEKAALKIVGSINAGEHKTPEEVVEAHPELEAGLKMAVSTIGGTKLTTAGKETVTPRPRGSGTFTARRI